jgi:peptidyl-prolyl cis-trans isomerase-like protein 2
MGRKSKRKDRAYITASEWKQQGGGKGTTNNKNQEEGFRRLPFHCCAIGFTPIPVVSSSKEEEEGSGVNAVVTDDGTVMDIANAVPYIRQHHTHPVTGEPLELKDLTRITFHTNADGEICCPVLGKVFHDNSHIVAIKSSGHVYSWEAVEELCLKPKSLKDLITDEPFKRSDIIHIQDPDADMEKRNMAMFDHVKNEKRVGGGLDGGGNVRVVSSDAQRALDALGTSEAALAFEGGGGGKKAEAVLLQVHQKNKQASNVEEKPSPSYYSSEPVRSRGDLVTFKPGTATWNTDEISVQHTVEIHGGKVLPMPYSYQYKTSHTSTGAASKSFTSTAMNVSTKNELDKELVQLQPKHKGYVRMHTTLGDLNIELHCDIVPRTCENFMALAAGEYYTGTKFHRSIPHFMIQGGDPTGTGKGGGSVFCSSSSSSSGSQKRGACMMKDEFDSRLTHNARGVLSMANSGPNTNGSQFFILYKSAHHLDSKHTVFGKVVGGFDVLTKMEQVPTDEQDVPVEDIKIIGCTIFVNPYTDLIQEQQQEEEKKRRMESAKAHVPSIDSLDAIMMSHSTRRGKGENISGGHGSGVGRYLKQPAAVTMNTGNGNSQGAPPQYIASARKKQKKATTLTNFDAFS